MKPTAALRPVLLAVPLLAAVLAGCSNSLPSSVGSAPVLSVATGLYPLEQAAVAIGGAKVAVDDVVPPGDDPFTFQPTAEQADVLRSAGLVIEVGGGFQPGLEAAATGARSTLRLRSSLGVSDGYVWLDPTTMQKAVQAMAGAMESADPGAAPLFRQNAISFADEIASTGIDFSSTLSTCPNTTIVTPDDALATMAAAYDLTVHVVVPDTSPAAVNRLASALRNAGDQDAAIEEPWVNNSGVAATAKAADLHTANLDTLAGPPPAGWPSGSNYLELMEKNLSVLSNALGCTNDEDGT